MLRRAVICPSTPRAVATVALSVVQTESPVLSIVQTQQQSVSDLALVEECLAHPETAASEKAFRALVERYSGLVFNVVYKMTHQYELAEEITQEAFVKAYQHLSQFDRARSFKPWLLRIASNTAISALRKKTLVQVPLDTLLTDQGIELAEGETSLSFQRQLGNDSLSLLERKLAQDEALALLTQLDPKYRQILILRYSEELSYEEIAEVLAIPLNTVRTWIRRGLEKLKQQALKEQSNVGELS